ncbi:MAG TPA: phosphatidate cytidylyltransferase [Gaiellaceae bacterium]
MIDDRELLWLFGGIAVTLVLATAVGQALRLSVAGPGARDTIANVNARIGAWWLMSAAFLVATLTGGVGSVVLFALVSVLALREFVTLSPTSRADHRALAWAFFVVIPVQYTLVGVQWYGLFSIMIPVYAFLLLATRMVLAGETERFLERTATVQWGLMACVYCVSYAPALLLLNIDGYDASSGKLLLFLVVVVQASDVLQFVWGKLLGRRRIAPTISPNKTWEGFAGGVACAALLGTGLWWATPFNPWQAAAMSLLIALAGFAGGLVMSAIKRDRGVKDYGGLLPGHGGVLDRIDSLLFAAPIFFHVTRFFF